MSVPVLPDACVTFAVDAPNNSSMELPVIDSRLPPLGPAGEVLVVLIWRPRLTRAALAGLRRNAGKIRVMAEDVDASWMPLTTRSDVTHLRPQQYS